MLFAGTLGAVAGVSAAHSRRDQIQMSHLRERAFFELLEQTPVFVMHVSIRSAVVQKQFHGKGLRIRLKSDDQLLLTSDTKRVREDHEHEVHGERFDFNAATSFLFQQDGVLTFELLNAYSILFPAKTLARFLMPMAEALNVTRGGGGVVHQVLLYEVAGRGELLGTLDIVIGCRQTTLGHLEAFALSDVPQLVAWPTTTPFERPLRQPVPVATAVPVNVPRANATNVDQQRPPRVTAFRAARDSSEVIPLEEGGCLWVEARVDAAGNKKNHAVQFNAAGAEVQRLDWIDAEAVSLPDVSASKIPVAVAVPVKTAAPSKTCTATGPPGKAPRSSNVISTRDGGCLWSESWVAEDGQTQTEAVQLDASGAEVGRLHWACADAVSPDLPPAPCAQQLAPIVETVRQQCQTSEDNSVAPATSACAACESATAKTPLLS
eukprot:CAMPEP_0194538802 /NCGR_PEP_ID=MMETSP0253-20130528/78477_1 /TAXON_ID=2966 /ORGANISM="Noctiluca scintillans" /LENGTH=434 /DNA_ID=CAMNT_0039384979 /DNA_START=75 /DNA_END=1379 /DNA_ORIENTATION=+